MRFAIVGTGYVADYYMATLGNHPELELVGVMDRDAARADRFARFYKLQRYATFEALLADERVELVANLTNPSSHYVVSKAALSAGKHVYSEKPLSTDFGEACELVELARSRGLSLSGAPCGVLGEAAQTVWKVLRDGTVGKVRLAYAEMDGGPTHLMNFREWVSKSGNPWPYQDEFETGSTLEHAGYYLTWLCAFFGPARRVTSFATELVPDKGVPVNRHTADFSVGCIEFDNGVVARLTCSIYASRDHRLQIFGEKGVVSAKDCWHYGTPLTMQPRTAMAIRMQKRPMVARLLRFGSRRVSLVRKVRFKGQRAGINFMDYCRGIADQAAAVREQRRGRLPVDFVLHVNEIVFALQYPETMGTPRRLTTSFEPIEPCDWAG